MTMVWTLLLIFTGPGQFQVVPAGQFSTQDRCVQAGELAVALEMRGNVRVASHVCIRVDR